MYASNMFPSEFVFLASVVRMLNVRLDRAGLLEAGFQFSRVHEKTPGLCMAKGGESTPIQNRYLYGQGHRRIHVRKLGRILALRYEERAVKEMIRLAFFSQIFAQ
jgi:hypothetical protein